MIRSIALLVGISAASAVSIPASDAIDAAFQHKESEVVAYTKAGFSEGALTPTALLDPFVDASRKLTRFKTPYVKVTKTDGEETYRYDREPSSAEDALALLELDELSMVLKYELLELDEWPEALAALLPARLVDTLTEDPYVGGTTVHAYLSAPGAVALPAHEDLGDVYVLQLFGEKTWSIDGREAFKLAPGDALWIPQGAPHSAVASTLSVHVTIHGITPDHVARHEAKQAERRRLHHITGDDGTIDDEAVYTPDSCGIWDAGCFGGRWGRCTCNLCQGCSDAGAFCMFEPSDVTLYDPCCKPGDDDGCDPYYHDDDGPGPYPYNNPRDAEAWVVLSKPDKGCDWVAEKPSKRCGEKGVIIHDEDHYGREWLLDNQPRWTADEACPVACGTVCGDDLSWTYTADGDKKDCVHVALKPDKRCDREGDDGRSAREACALTCDNCGKLPLATPRPTGKPSFQPTKKPFTADTWKATDEDIQQAVNDWRKRRDEALEKYGPISDWDVSQVTDMYSLFRNFKKFDDDISKWDTSGVTDMALICVEINQCDGCTRQFFRLKTTIDISNWKTGNVKTMRRMFASSKFQGSLSEWDVSRVADFEDMFRFTDFNGDISKWDVSFGKKFGYMFFDAPKFNQDLSAWKFSDKLEDLSSMFKPSFDGSSVFDQDLGWCFPKPQRDYDLRLSMFTGTQCAYRDCGVKFEGKCDEPGPPPFPDGACRGRAICRCDSQSFCNFDGGDSSFWSCERCSSFESVEKCSTDGLPEAGEQDCKACCFGDSGEYTPTYKPTVEPQPTYRPTVQDTCSNGKKDGEESDVDCGGPPPCPRCEMRKKCRVDQDCETDYCEDNKCWPDDVDPDDFDECDEYYCGNDPYWRYDAGDKGPLGCDDIAAEPEKIEKRCRTQERVGVDATGREVRASVACKGVCRESCEGC